MQNLDKNCEEKLADLTKEIDHTSKMLIRRDIALMTANAHLEALDQSKSEFVSIAAHQLRTPLTSIKWFSEMLMSSVGATLESTQKKNLENIVQASGHMSDLINSLLSVSRLELGTLDMRMESVAIEVLVDKITSDLDGLRAKKSIEKIVDIDKNVSTVESDRQFLEMILHNLISNAYKYTPTRGIVTITLHKKDEDFIKLSVADTGYGIPKDEQKKVFTKFYRASNIRDGADGTGLGLHIIQMATEKLGGTLTMRSIENEGTTFTVTIPNTSNPLSQGSRPE